MSRYGEKFEKSINSKAIWVKRVVVILSILFFVVTLSTIIGLNLAEFDLDFCYVRFEYDNPQGYKSDFYFEKDIFGKEVSNDFYYNLSNSNIADYCIVEGVYFVYPATSYFHIYSFKHNLTSSDNMNFFEVSITLIVVSLIVLVFGIVISFIPTYYDKVKKRTIRIAKYVGDDYKEVKSNLKEYRKYKLNDKLIDLTNHYYDLVMSYGTTKYGDKMNNAIVNSLVLLSKKSVYTFAYLPLTLFIIGIMITGLLFIFWGEMNNLAYMTIYATIPGGIVLILYSIIVSKLFYKRYENKYKQIVNRTCDIAGYLGEDKKALKNEFKDKREENDLKWFYDTTNAYYDKCEELLAERESALEESKNENGKSGFFGSAWTMFGIEIAKVLVTTLTLGLAYPWFVMKEKRWYYSHTYYDGKKLSYDGTATGLFVEDLRNILLTIITIGLYSFYIPKRMKVWHTKHTHIEGEMAFLGSNWTGSALGIYAVDCLLAIFNLLTLGWLRPFVISWQTRYHNKRMVIDGRRLTFNGHAIDLLWRNIGWSLLTIITLGCGRHFKQKKCENWKASHTHIVDGYEVISKL